MNTCLGSTRAQYYQTDGEKSNEAIDNFKLKMADLDAQIPLIHVKACNRSLA